MRTLTPDEYHRLPDKDRDTLDQWLTQAFPLDDFDRYSTPTPYRDFLPIYTLTVGDDGTVTAEVLTDQVDGDEIVTRTVAARVPGPPPAF